MPRGFINETIMLHVNTKDNENGRRRRDRPLGLSNRKGEKTKGLSLHRGVGGGFLGEIFGKKIKKKKFWSLQRGVRGGFSGEIYGTDMKQSCYMLTQRTMKMGVDVGTDLKVCPYSVVFGGDFRVKTLDIKITGLIIFLGLVLSFSGCSLRSEEHTSEL